MATLEIHPVGSTKGVARELLSEFSATDVNSNGERTMAKNAKGTAKGEVTKLSKKQMKAMMGGIKCNGVDYGLNLTVSDIRGPVYSLKLGGSTGKLIAVCTGNATNCVCASGSAGIVLTPGGLPPPTLSGNTVLPGSGGGGGIGVGGLGRK
ncbi:MAG: hypothetical protein JNG84_10795 [Archangium sp.]|nr:hypothetical protein [Archangium sp.]